MVQRSFCAGLAPCLALCVVGCTSAPDTTQLAQFKPLSSTRIAPPSTQTEICWARIEGADIRVKVREQVVSHPAQVDAAGVQISPEIYRTQETEKSIGQEPDTWFQRPCPSELDRGDIETLQRALAARGHYNAQITGALDTQTAAAIKTYQSALGLDSAVLSREAAQRLGVLAIDITR